MIRWTWRWQAVLLILLAGVGLGVPAAAQEAVSTDDGTFTVWHRTPAKEADLEMPFCTGILLESAVYRVRDRKKRDVLRYAIARFSTTQKIDEIVAQYRRALGLTARSEKATTTGVITLCDGIQDDCRIVSVTPQGAICRVTLTRIRRFTPPPRVYSDREQQALRILRDVAATYQAARRIAYHFEQTVTTTESNATSQPPPVLMWDVEFVRPAQLRVTATLNGEPGLTITTTDGKLVVTRPGQPDETRPLTLPLTLAQVPELEGDVYAHLMLGDNLVTKLVDYLGLLPVDGQPLTRQAQLVLTYPENMATLHLELEMTRKIVLRSVVAINDGTQRAQIVRTYRDVILEPAAAAVTEP